MHARILEHYALIKGAFIGVAATLLLLAAAWLGWRFYCDWRLGRVELTNEGTPVNVEVLSESGIEPIGEPIALIRRKVLSLPDGEYRLRQRLRPAQPDIPVRCQPW